MIDIYQGITSTLLVVVFMILFGTGWFQSLIPMKPQKLLAILFLFLIISKIEVPVSQNIKINVGGFFLMVMIYFFLWVKYETDQIYAFSSAMLIGAIYFTIQVFLRLDPILIIMDKSLQVSLILAIVILLIAQNIINGIGLYLGGILIGELFLFFYDRESGIEIVLGSRIMRDTLIYGAFEILILFHILYPIKHWMGSTKIHLWRKKQIND